MRHNNKQRTANENATTVGSNEGSDQHENNEMTKNAERLIILRKKRKFCETPTRLEPT